MDAKHNDTTTEAPKCQCGCGGTTKGGRFLPGHDSKLKRDLIEAALGGSKRAVNKLESLGWTKFLDVKREKLASAEAKQTGRPHPRGRPSRKQRGGDPTEETVNSAAEVASNAP